MASTKPSNMRLDQETELLIKALKRVLGGTKTGIVRQAVRELAKKEGINTMVEHLTAAQTLEDFIASDEFAEAVVKSTKASFGGSSYKVELFPSGSWRILWANEIGNRYETPGQIVNIPALDDDDYNDFTEMAGDDDIVPVLHGTDQLDEIASQMRNSL